MLNVFVPYDYTILTCKILDGIYHYLENKGFKNIQRFEFEQHSISIHLQKTSNWFGEFLPDKDKQDAGITNCNEYVPDKAKHEYQGGNQLIIDIGEKQAYLKDGKVVEEDYYTIELYCGNYCDSCGMSFLKEFEIKKQEDLDKVYQTLDEQIKELFGDWRI